ncbi:hypothetical protein Y024_5791 [Burkholderia pseudomallei TSV44]|nr:hypothetical protein Y024_5791 [Burkholderia pseudomallei TSV44]
MRVVSYTVWSSGSGRRCWRSWRHGNWRRDGKHKLWRTFIHSVAFERWSNRKRLLSLKNERQAFMVLDNLERRCGGERVHVDVVNGKYFVL